MGELSRFYLLKQLSTHPSDMYRQIFRVQQEISDPQQLEQKLQELYHQKSPVTKEFYNNKMASPQNVGTISFTETEKGLYYEHMPEDWYWRMDFEQTCKLNIFAPWLLCFDFSEMKVGGDEKVGTFFAKTTIKQVRERLYHLQFITKETFESRTLANQLQEILEFISKGTGDQDYLILDSNGIFDTEEGQFGIVHVRNDINKRIKKVREYIHAPHWKKSN